MPKHKRKSKKQVVVGSPPPTVRIKSSRYQPSKAELEEEIHIDATPEELAKAVLKQVKIEREE